MQQNAPPPPAVPGPRADVALAPWRARAAAALLVLGAFAVVLAWVPSRLFDLERYLVPKALALHVTALGLLALGVVPLHVERWGRTGRLLAAAVGWSAVSSLLAANRWLAVSSWGVGFSSAVVFLGARALPRELRWRAFGGVLAAVAGGAGLGLAQAYGVESVWLSDSRPPGGTFGNRNFLGHVAAIAVPGLLMFTACARRRWAAALGMLGVGVLAAAIVLTRSRAAWLGAVGGVATAAVSLWWVGRASVSDARLGRLGVAAAVAALAVLAAVFLPNQLDWRTDSPYASTFTRLADYQAGSGRGRLVQYGNSLKLVARNPLFGSGPGNWFVDYPLVTSRRDPAYSADPIPTNPWPSSDWVAWLVERGVVGALLLLLAGGSALIRVVGPHADLDGTRAAAAGVVVGALSAAFVCGTFDAVLLLAAPAYLTWALVGLLLPRDEESAPAAVAPARARRLAASAIALALVVLAAGHSYAISLTAAGTGTRVLERAAAFAPGEHRLQLALAQRGRCGAARRAAALMPHHPRVAALAARCG